MTKEEIIEAATFCAKNEECKDCKFCGIGCCTTEFAKYITGQKKTSLPVNVENRQTHSRQKTTPINTLIITR